MAARSVGSTFLRGLAAVLPVAVTLYVLWWLATTAEASLGGLARRVLGDDLYLPGTGVVLGFGLVFAVGVVMRTVVVRRLHRYGEGLLERLPLVKSIYGPLKDLMGFLADTDDRPRLERAVRVDWDGGEATLVGFLTRDGAEPVTRLAGDERVVVYLPMSYQLGGYMVVVPRAWVTELDLSVEEVLRTALTAGMSVPQTRPPAADGP